MKYLPIICKWGIGDSLMLLGRIPIRYLGLLGFRFKIYYAPVGHPALDILRPFFESIQYCQFTSEIPSVKDEKIWQKMLSLFSRFKVIWKVPYIEPLHEKIIYKKFASLKKSVFIQTHQENHHGGADASAKKWRIENWIRLIQLLHESDISVSIIEFNNDAKNKILSACPYVIDHSDKSLIKICSELYKYDCVVSVCSWVKYAASWESCNQVIIVPDLRKGYLKSYENVDPDFIGLWIYCGLTNKKENTIIGLRKSHKYEFSLPDINDLNSDVLYGIIYNKLNVADK